MEENPSSVGNQPSANIGKNVERMSPGVRILGGRGDRVCTAISDFSMCSLQSILHNQLSFVIRTLPLRRTPLSFFPSKILHGLPPHEAAIVVHDTSHVVRGRQVRVRHVNELHRLCGHKQSSLEALTAA
jgi:hypothetical protein